MGAGYYRVARERWPWPSRKDLAAQIQDMTFLVIFVSIICQDTFHWFDPVVKNKSRFRGLNLIHKLDEYLKKLIEITEYTT
jgi:hypothetical protein